VHYQQCLKSPDSYNQNNDYNSEGNSQSSQDHTHQVKTVRAPRITLIRSFILSASSTRYLHTKHFNVAASRLVDTAMTKEMWDKSSEKEEPYFQYSNVLFHQIHRYLQRKHWCDLIWFIWMSCLSLGCFHASVIITVRFTIHMKRNKCILWGKIKSILYKWPQCYLERLTLLHWQGLRFSSCRIHRNTAQSQRNPPVWFSERQWWCWSSSQIFHLEIHHRMKLHHEHQT